MNKPLKIYTAVWALCLLTFNLIIFIVPNDYKFSGSFWTGYAFVTLAFICQLACFCYLCRNGNYQNRFYSIPMLIVSYIGVAASLAAGGVTSALPPDLTWLGFVICLIVLVGSIIMLLAAATGRNTIYRKDMSIRRSTYPMKFLVSEIESILTVSDIPKIKSSVKNVYENIRYSDPMSDPALAEYEEQVHRKAMAFKAAAGSENINDVLSLETELLTLLEERNKKCKLLK